MAPRTFNLRLWFAVCSLGTIAIMCAAAAFWLTQYMTKSLLEREGQISQDFLESIVNVNGAETFQDDEGASTLHPMLLDFSQHLLSLPGVVRVNVHSSKHRVLWSTEPKIVGQVFANNDELSQAFNGSIVTEISSLDEDLKAEHIALGSSGTVIESYIPIRSDAGKGPIIGVVEFYRLPLSLETTLRNGQRVVWASAALAAVLLFLALYWIVQRGARVIERQQDHLARMEAFAAIGQMASAVAHSLRNPMSAIRSSAELWQTQLAPGERAVTGEVIAEVDRMDRYVRDLLAYARAEPYHLQPVDAEKVIRTILDKQGRAAERQRIDVRWSRKEGMSPLVMADEMLLEQALTSVVTNAIEAMADGGTLDLTVAPAAEKGRVRIAIADTGRGIPAELLKRVTESYFTTKSRGLGLGLVLARGIIERFEGSFEIASSTDVGTSVFVDLKAA